MSVLPMDVMASFLATVGVTPQGTPGEFDRAVRELEQYWAAGGSVRGFVSRYSRRGSVPGARAELERKRRPSWP